jgi:hypothetical protein
LVVGNKKKKNSLLTQEEKGEEAIPIHPFLVFISNRKLFHTPPVEVVHEIHALPLFLQFGSFPALFLNF